MHIAAFADVHANLTALRAVLRDIDAHGPFDLVVSNGDQIFGGPRPLDTWRELERVGAYCLCGNTERDLGTEQFPPAPAGGQWRDRILEVFDWTMDALPDEVRELAAQLPQRLDVRIDHGPLLVVSHANGVNLDDFIWADTDPGGARPLDRNAASGVAGRRSHPRSVGPGGGPTRVMRAGSVGLMYEANAFNEAHWTEITWNAPGHAWHAERHAVTWDHTAEIAAGRAVGYPGTEILPGYERA